MLILSPHIDDAGFSFGAGLVKSVQVFDRVGIVNFFTASVYSTIGLPEEISIVSSLRKAEEKAVCALLQNKPVLHFLDLPDAPIRNEFAKLGYYRPDKLFAEDQLMLEAVKSAIRNLYSGELVFVPAGLGDHADHVLVNFAAAKIIPTEKLVFYEDQPYGGRLSETELLKYIAALELRLQLKLIPAVVRIPGGWLLKEKIIHSYASQLDEATVSEIRTAFLKYENGERIWIPEKLSGDPRLIRLLEK